VLETATLAPSANTGPAIYSPRRPAAILLHRTVREYFETYLASAGHDTDLAANDPFHPRTPLASTCAAASSHTASPGLTAQRAATTS
jgi:hypothetical protein